MKTHPFYRDQKQQLLTSTVNFSKPEDEQYDQEHEEISQTVHDQADHENFDNQNNELLLNEIQSLSEDINNPSNANSTSEELNDENSTNDPEYEQSTLERIRLGNKLMEDGMLKLETLRQAQQMDPSLTKLYYSEKRPKQYKIRSKLLIHGEGNDEKFVLPHNLISYFVGR